VGGPAPLSDRWKRLRLTVDYRAPTPVWVDDGQANVGDLTPLHLPPTLATALIAWAQQFEKHFALDRWPHWDSKAAERWHVAEGHRLFDELVRVLPDTRITLDIWAVDTDSVEQENSGVQPPSAGIWVHEPDVPER
jgi:hypothetical protein